MTLENNTKHLLGICGSPLGRKSKCFELLNRALTATGVDFDIAVLCEEFDVNNLQDKMRHANGFIIATPVHWFNVSWLIKRFIDEVLFPFSGEPYELEDKPVGIIAVCNEDGANQAIANIAMPLNYCGVFVPPFGTLIHNKSIPGHGEDGWQDDAESIGKQIAYYL